VTRAVAPTDDDPPCGLKLDGAPSRVKRVGERAPTDDDPPCGLKLVVVCWLGKLVQPLQPMMIRLAD